MDLAELTEAQLSSEIQPATLHSTNWITCFDPTYRTLRRKISKRCSWL